MEEELDKIQEGDVSSIDILENFYGRFVKMIDEGYEKMYVDEQEPTGEKCPKCGHDLVYKFGKNGRFVACSNYPECDYVQKEKKELKHVGRTCPECGSPLVEREKNGTTFIACSNYPKCRYVEKKEVEIKPIKKCPHCEDGMLIRKKGKYGYFLGCTNYPKCNYMEKIKRKGRK